MAYRIKGLGWLPDPPDFRDWKVRHARVQRRLASVGPLLATAQAPPAASPGGPLRADLRKWCSPVDNQGEIGSCTAQATVGALEYFERRTRGIHVDASRRFLYKVTRRYLGWTGDSGAFVRTAIKALRLFGTCPEAYWPYDEEAYDAEPEAFHYALAANFKAVEYFRLDPSIDQLKSSLHSGLPFIFGFTCFSSLHGPSVDRTGVVPFPGAHDDVIGGHAVLAVGYTDSHVLFRNSWGTRWGEEGYGYLPWTYFDASHPLADDLWALVNASWLPPDEADAVALAPAGRAPRLARPRRERVEVAPVTPAPEPLIKVIQGTDPLRAVPLRLTARGVEAADGGVTSALARMDRPVSLYLETLTLKESFDWSLFGGAVNEVYFVATAWDLSGAPPVVYPPASIREAQATHPMKKGDRLVFLGDGVSLWDGKPVVGALYVHLLIVESDSDVRAFGTTMEEIRKQVTGSSLATALGVLAAGAVSPAMLAAVGTAAGVLFGVLANLLKNNGDDVVAVFEGAYGADRALGEERTETYDQGGAEIVLRMRGRT